jgi:protein-L-isoaspartate(D-aspartate) O-methyltransferase
MTMTTTMNFEQARFNMIEQQIRPWDVLDTDILTLLSTLKRENFVQPEHRNMAFTDMALPLPAGEFMLSPKLEARLVQDLKVQAHEHVLEIGAGSGYTTALLAKRAANVIALEINPELVEFARENLADAAIHNAEVRLGDGAKDAAALGQFDVIVLSGSVASIPQALLNLLKPLGRLVAIVGFEPVMRAHFVTRNADHSFTTVQPWDTIAPRLHNFPEPSSFSF